MRNITPLSNCRRDFLDVLAATTSLLLINGLPAWAGQQPGGSSSGPTVEGVIDDLVAANRILPKSALLMAMDTSVSAIRSRPSGS